MAIKYSTSVKVGKSVMNSKNDCSVTALAEALEIGLVKEDSRVRVLEAWRVK